MSAQLSYSVQIQGKFGTCIEVPALLGAANKDELRSLAEQDPVVQKKLASQNSKPVKVLAVKGTNLVLNYIFEKPSKNT